MMGEELQNNSSQECAVSWIDPKFWISGVLLVIIATIGVFGNFLIMAVLCKPTMRRSLFNNLLLALCCFDNLLLLSWAPFVAYYSLACHYVDIREYFFPSLSDIILNGPIHVLIQQSRPKSPY